MAKYTPGPWEWVVENGDIEIRMGDAVINPYNHSAHNSFKYVDMIETYKEKQKEQAIANANLMIAAPKLLGAVEQGYEMIDTLAGLSSWDGRSEDEINEVMNMMLEAMKKAKGDGDWC